MNKKIFIFFISLLFLTSYLYSQEQFTKEEQEWINNNSVKIAMLNNFAPFSFVENGIHKGFTLDLVNKISKNTGIRFEIITSKWSKSLKSFKEKEVDIICGISYTKERESFTKFTEPYYEIPTFIFGLKNKNEYKDNSSLKGKTVAVAKDIFYIKTLNKMGIKTLEVPSSFEKAKAVITGKADYFLANYTTGIKSINEQSLTGLKVIDEFYDIKKEDLRFGVREDKPLLHSIMNKALNNISPNELKNLSNKWIVFNNDNPNEKIVLNEEEKEFLNNHHIVKYSAIDWEPLFTVENGIVKGMMGDYIKLIERRTGLIFEYIKTDSIEDLHSRFEQGIISVIPTIDHTIKGKINLKTNSFVEYPMMIITDEKYKYIEDFSELNHKKVAILNIPPAINYIKQNYKTINIKIVSDVSEALLLVKNNKADAFVGHIAPSVFFLNQIYTDKLKISGTTHFKYKHLFFIKENNEVLTSIINKAIDTISPVEKNQIYSKWVQTNTKEKIVDYSLIYKIGFFFIIIFIFIMYRQYELRKINRNLLNSNKQIEAILDSTLEGIVISEDSIITNVNKEILKLLQYKNKSDLIGKNLFDMVSAESVEKISNKMKTNDTKPYEVDLRRLDNTLFPALVRGTNLIAEDKKLRISSVVDISDIKNQEKLFLQQSKMAALGEMIGNIAHQWRQPLSIITTSASGLRLKDEYGMLEKKDITDITDAIVESANYLSRTIDDFDKYLKGEKKLEKIDINDIIKTNINIIQEDFKKHNIKLLAIDSPSIILEGYKSELIQAVLNILYNARDALLKIDSEKYTIIRVFKENGFVAIEIQDSAGGIPQEILNKIYEPYFTTKHQSQGTGLGLYMTYNIIKEMGGDIHVSNTSFKFEDKEYEGAKFVIKLPIVL